MNDISHDNTIILAQITIPKDKANVHNGLSPNSQKAIFSFRHLQVFEVQNKCKGKFDTPLQLTLAFHVHLIRI